MSNATNVELIDLIGAMKDAMIEQFEEQETEIEKLKAQLIDNRRHLKRSGRKVQKHYHRINMQAEKIAAQGQLITALNEQVAVLSEALQGHYPEEQLKENNAEVIYDQCA